jgi:hypothetical protein
MCGSQRGYGCKLQMCGNCWSYRHQSDSILGNEESIRPGAWSRGERFKLSSIVAAAMRESREMLTGK